MLTLVSCEGLFIPDPIDPRLPKYTENGNNVAGAFINDESWKSVVSYGFMTASDKPTIITSDINDSLVILFEGNILNHYTAIEFHLTGLNIHRFEDLILLKNRKIQLDGLTNAGVIRYDNSRDYLVSNGGIGQIYIRYVTFNNLSDKVILSGTFGFTTNDTASGNKEVSYGRFDYVFSKDSDFHIE